MLGTSQVIQMSAIHEVTHDKSLDSFRMGAGHQPCDRRVEILSQLNLQRGERACRFSSATWQSFNQLCLSNETPIKPLDSKAQWGFLVGKYIDVSGG